MADTYTQILVQFIFAVKGRQNLIREKHRERIEKYICGIISQNKSKPLAIYCNPDHCHVLVGLHPSISISDMANKMKTNSSKWINENLFVSRKFSWQGGYGAFSYSRSQLDTVVKYILNQPEHHKKRTFREEYLDFLEKFNVEYDQRFIFDFME